MKQNSLRHPLVAHDCGYPLSRYTCRATRVAADFLDFIAFCMCSSGVAPHPLKILVSHLPPPFPGGVAPKVGSEKVSRYTGVSQVQLRVSRYTVQLRDTLGEQFQGSERFQKLQEPREGDFSTGGFCRVQCHAQDNKSNTEDIEKTTKDPEIKGSRDQQRSVTDHPPLSDSTKTQYN